MPGDAAQVLYLGCVGAAVAVAMNPGDATFVASIRVVDGYCVGLGLVRLPCCVEVSAAVAMSSSKEADMLRSLEAFRYATVTKAGHDQTYLFNDSPFGWHRRRSTSKSDHGFGRPCYLHTLLY